MRNTGEKESELVEMSYFKWYDGEILHNFIEDLRVEEFGPKGWRRGDPLRIGMEAVVSNDGAGPQLIVITQEENMRVSNEKMTPRNKGNPQSTDQEQVCAIAQCFKNLHSHTKHLNVNKCVAAQNMKDRVKGLLRAEKVTKMFILGVSRLEDLADWCGEVPQMLQRALTPQHIHTAFVRNGMITDDDYVPDLDQMYKTCCRKFTPEDLNLLHSTLVPFLEKAHECGYVPEDFFEEQATSSTQTLTVTPF